jgi:hypothetical protein
MLSDNYLNYNVIIICKVIRWKQKEFKLRENGCILGGPNHSMFFTIISP